MRAAIYTRFSSDRQSELSTQAQVRACREYAESNGIEIVHIYSDEAISGTEEKTDSRLQYQTLLDDAKKKAFDMIQQSFMIKLSVNEENRETSSI